MKRRRRRYMVAYIALKPRLFRLYRRPVVAHRYRDAYDDVRDCTAAHSACIGPALYSSMPRDQVRLECQIDLFHRQTKAKSRQGHDYCLPITDRHGRHVNLGFPRPVRCS